MKTFYKQENDQMIATAEITAVLSEEMFTDGLSEIKDDKVETIGFIDFKVWIDREKDKYELRKLTFPMTIIINANNIFKEGTNYYIDYYPNDIIIEQTIYALSATIGAKNANGFLSLLTNAKIKTEKPEDLIDIFKNAIRLNGVSMRVQSALIEGMIGELCRYSEDDTKPFRLALKDKNVTRDQFIMVNIKDVARLSSVFSAISFEDIKKSLESSVLMTRNNSEQAISPVETVLKF
jgi:hypothetical protein